MTFIFRRRARAPFPQDIAEREPAVTPKSYGHITRVITWAQGALGLQTDKMPNRFRTDAIIPVLEQSRPVVALQQMRPDPAAGTGAVAWIIPAGQSWNVMAVHWRMISDVNVANRVAWIQLQLPPGTDVYRAAANFNQVASTSVSYTAAHVGVVGDTGISPAAAATPLIPIADMWLLPGSQIRIGFENFQAGDNINLPVISYRWIPV